MEENKKEQFHTNLQITDLIRLHKKAITTLPQIILSVLRKLTYSKIKVLQ